MGNSHNLQRFVEAQNTIFEQVVSELRAGHKRGHWMWFIFPQLKGLGRSPTAMEFGIASREEAEEFLKHSVLGPRLVECTELVNAVNDRSIDAILGYPDDLKFRSSMTLFTAIAPEEPNFRTALEKYFDGQRDELTIELLRRQA